ncbi:MAG: hypothetical protein U0Q07_16740 [Acidimicrobiales bacterium]
MTVMATHRGAALILAGAVGVAAAVGCSQTPSNEDALSHLPFQSTRPLAPGQAASPGTPATPVASKCWKRQSAVSGGTLYPDAWIVWSHDPLCQRLQIDIPAGAKRLRVVVGVVDGTAPAGSAAATFSGIASHGRDASIGWLFQDVEATTPVEVTFTTRGWSSVQIQAKGEGTLMVGAAVAP